MIDKTIERKIQGIAWSEVMENLNKAIRKLGNDHKMIITPLNLIHHQVKHRFIAVSFVVPEYILVEIFVQMLFAY
jgi:hypothetical protein